MLFLSTVITVFKHQQKYDVESDLVENEVAIFKTLIFFELNPTFI